VCSWVVYNRSLTGRMAHVPTALTSKSVRPGDRLTWLFVGATARLAGSDAESLWWPLPRRRAAARTLRLTFRSGSGLAGALCLVRLVTDWRVGRRAAVRNRAD
jgi:hypothetical protein